MCIPSKVYGTNVFIDTRIAKDMSLSSGIVCTCSVKSQVGKVINITSHFNGDDDSECGSSIIYDSDGLPGRSKTSTCITEQFVVSSHDLIINFNKEKAPYQSEYCLGIQLSKYLFLFSTCVNKNILDNSCIHSDHKNRVSFLKTCFDVNFLLQLKSKYKHYYLHRKEKSHKICVEKIS